MYDVTKADHAVNFINCLKHTKGKWRGVPFELLPWQDEIIRTLYGTVKENGYRQYNTCYCEIPKKNGKSELAAAIALYMTCGDGEWGAEVYGCASDRQQASIVFDVAVDMVDQCPALKKRIKPVMSVKRLVYKPTNSFYQVLSAEAYTKHGLNVHAVIFDELHAQPNRELFDVMTKGSGDARMQPLYFLITTAGTDTQRICYETHQKALDIIEGRKHDPTFYPVIYGAAENEDWTDPKVWKKANPSLGITVGIDKVKAACESAKQNPGEENSFRQLRLNQWVKQAVRWMPMDKWDACSFAVDPESLEGRVCYGGLDLSSSTDITAFVLVFPPEDETDKYSVLPFFWIPEDNMELRSFLHTILSENYKVIEAINGQEGLERAQEHVPDLIISDIMMPVMDGLDMVKNIKENREICHIPIILLSAKSSLDDRISGLEQGIDDYITKPFSATYLKARIKSLLHQRKQLQDILWKQWSEKQESPAAPSIDISPSQPQITPFDEQFMQQVMEVMEKEMDNSDLTIEEFAQKLNMGRTVFYQKLKSIIGLSPVDFIREIRIKRAVQLIDSGEYNFSQVAYMTGFNDPKYFSKCFKKQVGMTPSEYKEGKK